MVIRDQVYAAADAVHRTGERVTQKRVIAHLQKRWRGLSPTTMGPLLLDWMRDRNYDARLEAATFSQPLKDAHVTFVEKVWAEALVEASLKFEDNERKVEALERAARQLADEAFADMEVAVREAALVRKRLAELEAEAAALRVENGRMRARLDRIRAEEFWDRVMREVADLMPVGGSHPMEEILARLKQSVHRGARLHKEPLTAETLRNKMAVRAWHKKLFEEGPDGTLVRKAG